ncbi:hypothetical protein K491DRAFT_376725 [Lophiostoma macrostomum CBS 122681]|uniref:Uncharacterized protein n=1 Tax=Lophiostoma macrostomum CBS 122681 TaxID=1314788 RepID=A0A6A6TC00_9PLEO|nr:hypothetical protein K491DRAFT_376725 [Lophiostoma macrostomum CBS 122681]
MGGRRRSLVSTVVVYPAVRAHAGRNSGRIEASETRRRSSPALPASPPRCSLVLFLFRRTPAPRFARSSPLLAFDLWDPRATDCTAVMLNRDGAKTYNDTSNLMSSGGLAPFCSVQQPRQSPVPFQCAVPCRNNNTHPHHLFIFHAKKTLSSRRLRPRGDRVWRVLSDWLNPV